MISACPSNFSHLKAHDEQLVRLGLLAERYFPGDPNTSLLKLRQLSELLAQLIATHIGLYASPEEKQVDLVRRLQDQGIVPREVGMLFTAVRKAGNDASHRLSGDHRTALHALRLTWQLSVWFHRTFKDPNFNSGPFLPPARPVDESGELKSELDQLRAELDQYRAAHRGTAQALDETKAQVRQTEEERAFWEQMAAESEAAKQELAKHLEALQAQAAAQPAQALANFVQAANTAAAVIQISEADTRKLIDEQLASAGWTVNSATLTHSKGARPQKSKFLAIAEWPTESGPADYVLFIGFTPIATVEAKRRNLEVSGALQQAKRYSRTFAPSEETELPTVNYGSESAYRVPFAFSSNGRPYLRQLATKSGIWFCDLRRADNLSQALDGWYTPEGLAALLKRDEGKAHEKLANEPFNYGFALRPYQQAAIRATEAVAAGQRTFEHLIGIFEASSPDEDKYLTRRYGAGKDSSADKRPGMFLDRYDPAREASIIQLLARNTIWQCPTLYWERGQWLVDAIDYNKDPDLAYAARSWTTQWPTTRTSILQTLSTDSLPVRRRFVAHELDIVRKLHAAGVPFLAGTDTPAGVDVLPGISLHLELQRFVAAGFTPLEALQTATLNPAKLYPQLNGDGSIQAGHLADLVLLRRNPLDDITNTRTIAGVIADGRYFSQREIDQLRGRVRELAMKR